MNMNSLYSPCFLYIWIYLLQSPCGRGGGDHSFTIFIIVLLFWYSEFSFLYLWLFPSRIFHIKSWGKTRTTTSKYYKKYQATIHDNPTIQSVIRPTIRHDVYVADSFEAKGIFCLPDYCQTKWRREEAYHALNQNPNKQIRIEEEDEANGKKKKEIFGASCFSTSWSGWF